MADRSIRDKRDRLRQLRAFCAAARFESLTKAAECLSVSQRAVALQVRSLEYELETELFDRNGPRVALTDAGRQFYRLANPLVEELDSLPESFADRRSELVSADIEVAATPVVAMALPSLAKRFLDMHPGVRLRVTSCPIHDGLRDLANGRVDAVLGPDVVNADFDYRPVFSYDLLLVVSELHPLAGEESVRIEQARAYPAVMPTVGTYDRRFEDAIGSRLLVAARVAVESSGWGVMKTFVRAGHGIAVIPSCCITKKDRVRGLGFDGYAHREGCGVFTRRQSLSLPVIDFVQTLAPGPPATRSS